MKVDLLEQNDDEPMSVDDPMPIDDSTPVSVGASTSSCNSPFDNAFNNKRQREKFRRFILAQPISETELAAVSKSVEANLKKALDLLAKEGPDAVFKLKEKDRKDREDRKRRQKEIAEQTLAAAAINGDARNYQVALLELAKHENIIVHLGTGLGKTLIAVMLIRHYFLNDAANQEKNSLKQALFLVPSVALAHQQRNVLQSNLPGLVVGTASGGSVAGITSRDQLAKCNVIVATHGAILDLLQHYGDVFQMERFCLLILDECHHCTGKSDYAKLMTTFYHVLDVESRPRVLGLTASPLINIPRNLTDAEISQKVADFERLVDARIVTPAELGLQFDDDPDNPLQKDIDVSIVNYGSNHRPFQPPPAIPASLNSARAKDLKRFLQIYEDLGPFIVGMYCAQLLKTLAANTFENESAEQLREAIKFLECIKAHCEQESTNDTEALGRSGKLILLEQLLERQLELRADAVGLVFVGMRATALALNHYFQSKLNASASFHADGGETRPGLESKAGVDLISLPPVTQIDVHQIDDLCDTSTLSPDLDQGHVALQRQSPIFVAAATTDPRFQDADDDPFARSTFSEEASHAPTAATVKVCNTAGLTACENDQFADAEGLDDPSLTAFMWKKAMMPLFESGVSGALGISPEQNSQAVTKALLPSSVEKLVEPVRSDVLVRKETNFFRNGPQRLTCDENAEIGRRLQAEESSIQNVLNLLRRGDVNVLFATSVVEEGVDVRACSFVVAFDNISNTKSWVQMKGRARQLYSKFFSFECDTAVSPQQTLAEAQALETRLLEHLAQRKPRSNYNATLPSRWPRQPTVHDDAEVRAIQEGYFKAPHGLVLVSDAKSLLNRYVLSIPMDASARSSRVSLTAHMPYFDRAQARLILPTHISSPVKRVVTLPESHKHLCYNKTDLSNTLCLMACVRLHTLGLLTDRLLPVSKDFLRSKVAMPIVTGARRSCRTITATDVNHGKAAHTEVFVYPIVQNSEVFQQYSECLGSSHLRLAIVTTAPIDIQSILPAFDIVHPQFHTVSISLRPEKSRACTVSELAVLSDFLRIIFQARWKTRGGLYKCREEVPSEDAESRPVLSHYKVGCVNLDGELDFDYMRTKLSESTRTGEQRREAVWQSSSTDPLPSARLWRPSQDLAARYIVYGPASEAASAMFPRRLRTEHIQTYQDYYRISKKIQVDAAVPLFVGQQLWKFPRKPVEAPSSAMDIDETRIDDRRPADQNCYCKGLSKVRLPQTHFEEMPEVADAGLFLLTTFLPQILYRFERRATAMCFQAYCSEHLPTLATVLTDSCVEEAALVLSARSCSESVSYETFEWLGDAVLKLAHTDCIIRSKDLMNWIQSPHEGHLDDLRSVLGENCRLAQICDAYGVGDFLLTKPLSRGQWVPMSLQLDQAASMDDVRAAAQNSELAAKLRADVMEALLGLVYHKGGYEKAMCLLAEMQAGIPWGPALWETSDQDGDAELAEFIAAFTGYRFRNGSSLLDEALTHPSEIDSKHSSYERLEWVGDAVLCLAVRDWIFRNYPDGHVGTNVLMESALSSNETLGFLSYTCGLHKFMRHCDTSLPGRIADYGHTLDSDRGLWGTNPPKCLADILEAVLGAIHVHGGFEQGQKAALFILQPLLSLILSENRRDQGSPLIEHPRTALCHFGGTLISLECLTEGEYFKSEADPVWTGRGWVQACQEGQRRVSTVRCCGVKLLSLVDSSNGVATNRACALILAVLRSKPGLLEQLCGFRATIDRTKESNDVGEEEEDDDNNC